MDALYHVYILASRPRVLYIGVTGRLLERVKQHREGLVPGFTSRYRIHRLVHFEPYQDVRAAIAREKEIKGWNRAKKVALIEKRNPTWENLVGDFFCGLPAKSRSLASLGMTRSHRAKEGHKEATLRDDA